MRVIKSNKIVNRYETQSILSCIDTLSRYDKQQRLLLTLLDSPLKVNFQDIKKQIETITRFRLFSKHYETIKQAFDKYNISIVFPKRISKKRKENEKVLMADHDVNHYQGNNIHVPR